MTFSKHPQLLIVGFVEEIEEIQIKNIKRKSPKLTILEKTGVKECEFSFFCEQFLENRPKKDTFGWARNPNQNFLGLLVLKLSGTY